VASFTLAPLLSAETTLEELAPMVWLQKLIKKRRLWKIPDMDDLQPDYFGHQPQPQSEPGVRISGK
jgi:hypothetical protein